MGLLVARRPRGHGPRLLEGPLLFRRTRRVVAELVGLVWLAIEAAGLARSWLRDVTGRSRR